MNKTAYTIFLLFLLFSCVPIKRMGHGEQFIPSLGTIGKEHKSLLNASLEQVGKPNVKDRIALSIREIQFNKAKFKTYTEYKTGRGEKPGITYSDSLSSKPKYLCLEISNKIALQSQLNEEYNKGVRDYLSNDEDYRIVSQIAFVTSPKNTQRIVKADGVFLSESNNGILGIALLEQNKSIHLDLSEWEIYDYKLSGFCWGKDKYGHEQIEAIRTNESGCPTGTEKNAQKLNETKSYLKL